MNRRESIVANPGTAIRARKNGDIQLLRAVAIILVMIQHYRNRLPTPEAYSAMFQHVSFWTGVDIFFAISGLLISHSFIRDLHRARSAKDASTAFWTRRMGRLFPALVFWVGCSVAVAAIAQHSPGAHPDSVAVSGLAAIFGVSNLYWSVCVQHAIASCGHSDFNGVTWSLSLEWQLYAALTLAIVAFGFKRAVGLMLLVAIVMSAFAAPSFSYPWAFRVQAFALGALTFLVWGKDGKLPNLPLPPLVCLVALILGVCICITAPNALPQPFVLPTVALGAVLCLVSALSGDAYSKSALAAPFVWIGERSYSIYLCHLPMFLLTKELMARSIGLEVDAVHVAVAVIGALGLTAVCGDLSYRYIETPFQALARRRIARLSASQA
jgi:peptidoglycan/LPS O-acetylase OafA/YrhL